MQGTIEKIWENRNQKGETYWVLLINGQRFSLWDGSLLEGLKEGDRIDFLWKSAGRFKNITKITKLSNGNNKQIRIIRMSCIRSAAELVSDAAINQGEKAELITRLEKQLESYVLGKEKGG